MYTFPQEQGIFQVPGMVRSKWFGNGSDIMFVEDSFYLFCDSLNVGTIVRQCKSGLVLVMGIVFLMGTVNLSASASVLQYGIPRRIQFFL